MGMSDTSLIGEKIEQPVRLLRETDTDCWLTIARETTEIDEPCLPFLLGFDVVWPTFVVVTREDDRHVVIGRHDAPNAEALGEYTVHPYDESFEPALRAVIDDIDPTEIAVNHARDDVVADGLTHGMYLPLTETLAGTGYEDALVSAREVVARLRSEKSSRSTHASGEPRRSRLRCSTSSPRLGRRNGRDRCRGVPSRPDARSPARERLELGVLSDRPRRGRRTGWTHHSRRPYPPAG